MEKKRDKKMLEPLWRAKRTFESRLEKYQKLGEEGLENSNAKKEYLETWLGVRKMKADGPLPKKKSNLIDLKVEWCNRRPLTLREHLLDLGKEEELVESFLNTLDGDTVIGESLAGDVPVVAEEECVQDGSEDSNNELVVGEDVVGEAVQI